MTARFLDITKRNRDRNAGYYASERDFDWTPAEPASFEQVVTDPNVTLYCFDPAGKQAIFVVTPPDAKPLDQPFMYLAQARNAQRLVGVPYAQLVEWSERCPTPEQLAMFICTGRCGSTLLSRLLSTVPELEVINEPDALTHAENLFLDGTWTEAEARPLLRATIRHWYKPGLKPGATWQVIKTRHELPAVERILAEELPRAKYVFMYRNPEKVIASFKKLRGMFAGGVERLHARLGHIASLWKREARLDSVGGDAPSAERARASVDALFAEHGAIGLEILHFAWVIRQYLDLRAGGEDIRAVRYETLLVEPDSIMTELMTHWGLRWDPSVTQGILAEDSQKDTPIHREVEKPPISPEEHELLLRVLPVICSALPTPEAILPGTIL